jgi:hypothetical protein
MADKKPEWSDYAYDNNSISKRLGIEKDEVQKLKDEAATKSKKTVEGIVNPPGSVGAGIGGSIDINDLKKSYLRVGAKIPGLSVEFDTNGEGNIDIVNLIRVETIRIKCFYIQRFYLAGQFLYSDIQKVDSEECNKEPEPEPDPGGDTDETPSPKPNTGWSGIGQAVWWPNQFSKSTLILKDKTTGEIIGISKATYTMTAKCSRYFQNENGILWEISIKSTSATFSGINAQYNRSYSNNSEGKLYYYTSAEIYHLYKNLSPNYAEWYNLEDLQDFLNKKSKRESSTFFMYDDYIGLTDSYLIYGNGVNSSSETNEYLILDATIPNYLNLPKTSPLTPNKKMEKECCDKLDKLLKRLAKYQGLGQKIKPINVKDNKIEEKGNKYDNFPMKIPKRWIDREAKPKDDYEVQNMRHLLLSVGVMLDRFEELFNPAGKNKGFPLKKPEEGLWKWLPGDGGDYEAPDPNYDPKKSKNDGKIENKKLKIETYLDLFRYFLESQIRLELLFPIAQIRDSEISKRLIYPKAPGTIKINDLIQFQELMLLFINKTLGDPSGAVIIKDADPTQEGAEPITIENFDISDMLRKLLRFSVDINSDIDLTNNFSKRTLYQLLSAMQVLVKNHEMTEAIFEDLGMKEEQTFVPVKFFADPYAGVWESGKGFDPNKIKPENTEAGIEANLQSFLQEKEVEVKVSRRAKDETTDIRDLLAQIGRYAAELAAMGKIPNNPEAIQQAIDKARFELQTESALRRTDVRQASAADGCELNEINPKVNNDKTPFFGRG